MNKQTREVMQILTEESAEVIQAVSKCIRFGLSDINPTTKQTNKQHLEEELGDLLTMVNLLIEIGLVDQAAVALASKNKIQKLKQWSTVFNTD